MIGQYKISGSDIYSTYGLLARPGFYNELLKLPKRKEGFTRSWPDENGTERDLTTVYYESRVLNLQFLLYASSEAQFYSRYNALTSFLLSSGRFNFDAIQMNRRFSLVYLDMTSFEKLTLIKESNKIYAANTLQVVDDFPTTNNIIPA